MSAALPSAWRSTSVTDSVTACLRGVAGSTFICSGRSLRLTTKRVPPMLRNWSSTSGR